MDASVVVTALADDGSAGDVSRDRLRHERLAAPCLLDVEVISAWRRLSSIGALDERRAELALADLAALRLERVPHRPLLDRCWELRASVTAYDAVYIALAELLEVTLVTADRRLATAPGTRCAVEVVG